MAYTESDLKAKTVKDLKQIAQELGVAVKASAKKDELVAAILAQEAGLGVDAALVDDAELGDDAGAADDALGGGEAAAAAAAAPASKHSIVFALQEGAAKPAEGAAHKANIQGIKVLSDAERAQLRAAKFGVTAAPGGSKAAGGGGGAKAPVNKAAEIEEQIKKLQRAEKYGTASEADKKKLESLKRQLEAEQSKQRIALDKVELMDPDRMAAREKKFGKPLTVGAAKGGGIKDPGAMRRRAEKFGKVVAPSKPDDDAARKKARLERFAEQK